MGSHYYLRFAADTDAEAMRIASAAGASADEFGDLVSFYDGTDDLARAIVAAAPDSPFGLSPDIDNPCLIETDQLAPFAEVRHHIVQDGLCSVLTSAQVLDESDAYDMVHDWLSGVTARHEWRGGVPVPTTLAMPQVTAVLNRDAEYIHDMTVSERLRARESAGNASGGVVEPADGPRVDVRPTVRLGGANVDIKTMDTDVTFDVTDVDSAAARAAAVELARTLTTEMPFDVYVRDELRDLMVSEPRAALGIIDKLASVYAGLVAARIDVVEMIYG